MKLNAKTKTQKLVLAAMMAALVCISTFLIKIPSPLHGYLHPGDCFVLISGWILSPLYGFLAAGLGSGLADLLGGYAVYAPATFLIKGVMALVVYGIYKACAKKMGSVPAYILGGFLAELLMIAGYLLFESMLYGFGPSLVNVIPNGVQGLFGMVVGVILIKVTEKVR